jgi:hypothetical protein
MSYLKNARIYSFGGEKIPCPIYYCPEGYTCKKSADPLGVGKCVKATTNMSAPRPHPTSNLNPLQRKLQENTFRPKREQTMSYLKKLARRKPRPRAASRNPTLDGCVRDALDQGWASTVPQAYQYCSHMLSTCFQSQRRIRRRRADPLRNTRWAHTTTLTALVRRITYTEHTQARDSATLAQHLVRRITYTEHTQALGSATLALRSVLACPKASCWRRPKPGHPQGDSFRLPSMPALRSFEIATPFE